jgi:hypothetical protein
MRTGPKPNLEGGCLSTVSVAPTVEEPSAGGGWMASRKGPVALLSVRWRTAQRCSGALRYSQRAPARYSLATPPTGAGGSNGGRGLPCVCTCRGTRSPARPNATGIVCCDQRCFIAIGAGKCCRRGGIRFLCNAEARRGAPSSQPYGSGRYRYGTAYCRVLTPLYVSSSVANGF